MCAPWHFQVIPTVQAPFAKPAMIAEWCLPACKNCSTESTSRRQPARRSLQITACLVGHALAPQRDSLLQSLPLPPVLEGHLGLECLPLCLPCMKQPISPKYWQDKHRNSAHAKSKISGRSQKSGASSAHQHLPDMPIATCVSGYIQKLGPLAFFPSSGNTGDKSQRRNANDAAASIAPGRSSVGHRQTRCNASESKTRLQERRQLPFLHGSQLPQDH